MARVAGAEHGVDDSAGRVVAVVGLARGVGLYLQRHLHQVRRLRSVLPERAPAHDDGVLAGERALVAVVGQAHGRHGGRELHRRRQLQDGDVVVLNTVAFWSAYGGD